MMAPRVRHGAFGCEVMIVMSALLCSRAIAFSLMQVLELGGTGILPVRMMQRTGWKPVPPSECYCPVLCTDCESIPFARP
jgi:hypothetical protein